MFTAEINDRLAQLADLLVSRIDGGGDLTIRGISIDNDAIIHLDAFLVQKEDEYAFQFDIDMSSKSIRANHRRVLYWQNYYAILDVVAFIEKHFVEVLA